jgi:hypothetical protein
MFRLLRSHLQAIHGLFNRSISGIYKMLAHMGYHTQWRTEGGWEVQPPRNSEVLTKLRQISTSVENTSLKTKSEYGCHSFAN